MPIFLYPYYDAYQHTLYSMNYHQKSFESISIGMGVSEVKRIIGDPLKVTSDENTKTEYHFYSQSKNDSNYFEKKLVMQNGKVVEKIDALYHD